MNRKNTEKIKDDLRRYIDQNSQYFPLIYQSYEINVNETKPANKDEKVQFGHYGTEEKNSVSFYKPFSKIVNFAIIDE